MGWWFNQTCFNIIYHRNWSHALNPLKLTNTQTKRNKIKYHIESSNLTQLCKNFKKKTYFIEIVSETDRQKIKINKKKFL